MAISLTEKGMARMVVAEAEDLIAYRYGPDADTVKKQLAEVERRLGNNATAQGERTAQ